MEDLRTKFLEAQTLFQSVNDSSLSSTDSKFQDDVKKCANMLMECRNLIKSESVFSKGEEEEDVNTEDLKYLLVEYYLACLQQKVVDDDRLRHISIATVMFSSYLERCHKMNLMTKENREVYLEVTTFFYHSRLCFLFIIADTLGTRRKMLLWMQKKNVREK